MTTIQISEYSDPACPFAWSAEPSRRRMEWLYGDELACTPRMVGLHRTGAEMEAKGLTTKMLANGMSRLAHAHHMPMDTAEPARLAGSVDACRAVVAVSLHEPARERMKTYRTTAIRPDAIGRAILYAIEQPEEVDVNELVVRPLATQV